MESNLLTNKLDVRDFIYNFMKKWNECVGLLLHLAKVFGL